MSDRYRIAALDIGGTKIKACLFEGEVPTQTVEGDTLARKGGAPAVLERAAALLRPLLPFDFIGVSTAGQVDPGTGVIRYANENLPGYTGMDVKGFFEARFHVPAVILNDVCAAALGEGPMAPPKVYGTISVSPTALESAAAWFWMAVSTTGPAPLPGECWAA